MSKWIQASVEMPPEGVAVVARRTAKNGFEWKKPPLDLEGEVNEYFGARVTHFGTQAIADLRALISIAVWIRSEQIAHIGQMIEIHDGSLRLELHTQDLHLQNAIAEMRAGQEWHKRLTALLPIPAPQPSYRKEQTPMKFFKFEAEAEGDQIFIKATDREHAMRIQEVKFGIPVKLLTTSEVKEKDLPEGESWIEE